MQGPGGPSQQTFTPAFPCCILDFYPRLKPWQDLGYKKLKKEKKNATDCNNCKEGHRANRKSRQVQVQPLRGSDCVILCWWLCFFWMFIPCLSFSIFNKIWETSCQLSQETSYDLTRKHDIIRVYTHTLERYAAGHTRFAGARSG